MKKQLAPPIGCLVFMASLCVRLDGQNDRLIRQSSKLWPEGLNIKTKRNPLKEPLACKVTNLITVFMKYFSMCDILNYGLCSMKLCSFIKDHCSISRQMDLINVSD